MPHLAYLNATFTFFRVPDTDRSEVWSWPVRTCQRAGILPPTGDMRCSCRQAVGRIAGTAANGVPPLFAKAE